MCRQRVNNKFATRNNLCWELNLSLGVFLFSASYASLYFFLHHPQPPLLCYTARAANNRKCRAFYNDSSHMSLVVVAAGWLLLGMIKLSLDFHIVSCTMSFPRTWLPALNVFFNTIFIYYPEQRNSTNNTQVILLPYRSPPSLPAVCLSVRVLWRGRAESI